MIVVCPNCSSRLQVDEEKTPAGPFTVRCPKCDSSVNSGPRGPASQKSALAVGSASATEHSRFNSAVSAPAVRLASRRIDDQVGQSPVEELGRLLANLLGQNGKGEALEDARPSWNPRRGLVCTAESHRESVAQQLAENGYHVFVAQDTRQAVERMRDSRFDVVLLDAEFDAAEQGAAFVTRELNVLRPAQRRRLFFVLLSPSLRTMEAHTAFLHNVNAIVNFKDIEQLPQLLDQSLREYNELYKDFNIALSLPRL